MNSQRIKILSILVATALVTASSHAEPPAVKLAGDASKVIRGTWQTLDLSPHLELPFAKWKVTEDMIAGTMGNRPCRFSYRIDSIKTPPAIDLTVLDGPDKGKVYPGIFLLDADYLDVCFDDRPKAKRPRAFVTTSDLGGNHSFMFMREGDPKLIDASSQTRFWMKHLANAFHGYIQKHGQLPPAFVADKAGKPLYSWRVELCPMIEQSNIYSLWQKDAAWDQGKINSGLSQTGIRIYASVRANGFDVNTTPYQVIVGKGTLWVGAKPQNLPDGEALSSTILMVESNNRVNWASPNDLFYEPNQPLPALGGLVEDGFHALMADGSIRFIKENFNEKVFWQLLSREKVKPVNWEDLYRK